jgi:UDP-arabinose 4-epimerase
MASGNILVAGGAGYIGSHTAKALHKAGYNPVVLDNFSMGNRFATRFGPCIEGDIADQALVEQILRDYEVSAAVLFAANAFVGESTQDPAKYYSNNLAGSLAFLEALRRCGVNRLVFSSSCSIYGSSGDEGPISESSAKDPLSPYAETKWFFERILHWYDNAYGFRSVCLRYFNAAGADPEGELGECHVPETHLIPLTILAAINQGELQIFGSDYPTPDGTAIRDYVHVTDLAAAHVEAVGRLLKGGASLSANLGTGSGYSVSEVVQMVERISGRTVRTKLLPRRPGDAAQLVANPALAREMLAWQPRYSSLETIVTTAWNWHSALEKHK